MLNVEVQLIEMMKVFYNVVQDVPINSYYRNNKEIFRYLNGYIF